MNIYRQKEQFTTVSDIANDLGEYRNTILRWLHRLKIPHTNIKQGKGGKIVTTLVPMTGYRRLAAKAKLKRKYGARSASTNGSK